MQNKLSNLERSISSVQNWSFNDFEVLLIGDGSLEKLLEFNDPKNKKIQTRRTWPRWIWYAKLRHKGSKVRVDSFFKSLKGKLIYANTLIAIEELERDIWIY